MKLGTRRKKEKKFLELLKAAADYCSDAITITAIKSNEFHREVVYANKAYSIMTGYKESEVLGKSMRVLQGLKTDPAIYIRLRKKLMASQSFHGKSIYYRKDRSEFYMEWDAAPIFDQEGRMTHFISVLRDITKKVTIEEAKDERIEVVSHELKTPLTAIKGFVEIMKRRAPDDVQSKTREYLDVIESEVERLILLTNELLETTQDKTSAVQPTKMPCNLDDVILQVVKNIRVTTRSHKIKRRGEIGTTVNCDRDRITQVLTNLLVNAIKYSPEASQVYLWVKRDEHHVIISIQDFGIGIAPEKQESIFKRFYRATDKKQAVSSGLGLYIASEIIRNHGGNIWVDSTEGKGSTFSFNLPLS